MISRLWTRFQATSGVETYERPQSGGPYATTQGQECYIVILARRIVMTVLHPTDSSMNAAGEQIACLALRSRLHCTNIRVHRPAVGPQLLPRRQQTGLE